MSTSRRGSPSSEPSPGASAGGAAGAPRAHATRELLVVAAATVLAYANSLRASFQLDDFPVLVWSDRLHDLRNLWPPSGTRWVGNLSFALNYRLGGLDVVGYHCANLAIHVGSALLLYRLAAITLATPAVRDAEVGPLVRRYLPLSAALLFGLHPAATQAVTYVVQRYASLATLFFLLSLVSYVHSRMALEAAPRAKLRAAAPYFASIAAALAAMWTKEISFTLPAVAAGYELLFFRRRRWLLLAPLGAVALLVPVFLAGGVLGAIQNSADLAAEAPDLPRSVYLLTQARVVVTYVRLLLLPVGQNVDYDFHISESLADPEVVFALAVLAAIAASAASLLVRSRKANRAAGVLAFFGVAWFFVTLSVESSVIPIRDVIFEHRMYLPSAGAAVTLATALLSGVERLRLEAISLPSQAAAALLLTATPLGVATYLRNEVWKDPITLWTDVVSKSPGKRRPHHYLGLHLAAAGRLDEAIREYGDAIRTDPRYAPAHNDLGKAYQAKRRLDDAIREHRLAVELDPQLAAAHEQLGAALLAQHDLEGAAQAYRDAVRLDPRKAETQFALGFVLATQGRAADAADAYGRALELEETPETVLNLAAALDDAGRVPEAIATFERFLELATGKFPDQAADVTARLAQLRRAPARGPR